MRIAVGIGVRVVLAVNRDPFLGLDARGDPDEETKEKCNRFANREGTVTEGPMQVHSGADIGDGGDHGANQRGLEDDHEKVSHGHTLTHYLLVGRQFRE